MLAFVVVGDDEPVEACALFEACFRGSSVRPCFRGSGCWPGSPLWFVMGGVRAWALASPSSVDGYNGANQANPTDSKYGNPALRVFFNTIPDLRRSIALGGRANRVQGRL